jgi:hypothetical protein
MNELQFLRSQVALERGHMASVRRACADALNQTSAGIGASVQEEFCLRCARYLVFIVARFNAQDQAHSDQLRPLLAADDAMHRETLDDLDRTLALNREALGALAAALQARDVEPSQAGAALLDAPGAGALLQACRAYLEFYERVLTRRRHVLAPLLEQHYRMPHWRRACFVTADTVLEEKALFGDVAGHLPPGITLTSSAPRATVTA